MRPAVTNSLANSLANPVNTALKMHPANALADALANALPATNSTAAHSTAITRAGNCTQLARRVACNVPQTAFACAVARSKHFHHLFRARQPLCPQHAFSVTASGLASASRASVSGTFANSSDARRVAPHIAAHRQHAARLAVLSAARIRSYVPGRSRPLAMLLTLTCATPQSTTLQRAVTRLCTPDYSSPHT